MSVAVTTCVVVGNNNFLSRIRGGGCGGGSTVLFTDSADVSMEDKSVAWLVTVVVLEEDDVESTDLDFRAVVMGEEDWCCWGVVVVRSLSELWVFLIFFSNHGNWIFLNKK